jgi:hypothetical protein
MDLDTWVNGLQDRNDVRYLRSLEIDLAGPCGDTRPFVLGKRFANCILKSFPGLLVITFILKEVKVKDVIRDCERVRSGAGLLDFQLIEIQFLSGFYRVYFTSSPTLRPAEKILMREEISSLACYWERPNPGWSK